MDGGSGWGPAQLKVRSVDRGSLPPPTLTCQAARLARVSLYYGQVFPPAPPLRPPLSRRRCLSLRRVSVYRRPR